MNVNDDATEFEIGEGSKYLGFGDVSCAAMYATLEEVDLGEDELVVESLEFGEQRVDPGEGRFVLVHF